MAVENQAPATAILTPAELHRRAGRVCVAVSGESMFAAAAQTAETTNFLEFRLDTSAEPASLLPQLHAFLDMHLGLIAVATCRRIAYGGSFNGTARQQLDILEEAAKAGCALVDIEVETAEESGPIALETLRAAGAAVILSWHDFAATPDLEAVLKRMQPHAPDFYKIVPTAQSLRDSLKLIDLLELHGDNGNLIAMSMGFRGAMTRVLGPRFGSAFTFAAPDSTPGTAPGQMAVSTLRHLYRIDAITSQTAIYAVAGEPITGSRSPLMHNTALAATGIDAVYLPLETADPIELREVLDRLNVQGLSITMPLKETMMPMLANADPAVAAVGACNTLRRNEDGTLTGFNTDVAGIVEPLQRHGNLHGKRVLILGAGGAARAAVYGMKQSGAEVFLLNRTVSKAEALAAEFHVNVQPRETLTATDFDIIIHTTPYGMRGQQHAAPITAEEMRCKLFFDTVYNPIETPLIQIARSRSIHVIPGTAMFVEQGVRQFELWTGGTAPADLMTKALTDSLEDRTDLKAS